MIDKFRNLVGQATHYAAFADIILFDVFYMLSGMQNVEAAKAVYFALDAIGPKKAIIQRLLKAVGDERDKELAELIIVETEKICTKRNELAHALVVGEVAEGVTSYMRKSLKDMKQPLKPVTADYIASIIGPINSSLEAAMSAWDKLCRKRGVELWLRGLQ